MKIINKYILDELKGPIILAVFVFTFIFLLDIVVTMMEHIIVKGISVFDVLRLLSFYIPPILTQTIPIGMFLGIMICFTKFSRNSESVAMVSTGMSIRAILKPILAIAIGAAIFIVFLQESIIPRSFVKLKYVGTKIAYENPVFQLKEKTFIDNLDGYSIYVDEVDSDGKAKNVIAFEKPKDKNKFSFLSGSQAPGIEPLPDLLRQEAQRSTTLCLQPPLDHLHLHSGYLVIEIRTNNEATYIHRTRCHPRPLDDIVQ